MSWRATHYIPSSRAIRLSEALTGEVGFTNMNLDGMTGNSGTGFFAGVNYIFTSERHANSATTGTEGVPVCSSHSLAGDRRLITLYPPGMLVTLC